MFGQAFTEPCEQQRGQLEAELAEFRKDLQRLAEEGLGTTAKAATEDELVAHWRLYSVSRVWRRHRTIQVLCVPQGIPT